MKSLSFERAFWAILLVIFGGVLLLQNLNIFDFNIWGYVWKFWPLMFIIPCLTSLFKTWNLTSLVLVIFGVLIIVSNFTNFNVWSTIWPVMIIFFGISLIFKLDNGKEKNNGEVTSDDRINETVIFGGVEKKINTKNFLGGDVDLVFGGAKLDLRDIEIKGKIAKLEITSVFGGCEILVNTKKYNVRANGVGVFGGWVNSYESSTKETPILEITGSAVFGGVEIK